MKGVVDEREDRDFAACGVNACRNGSSCVVLCTCLSCIYKSSGNATITKTEGYVVWNYFHQKQPRVSQIATSI